MLDRLAVKHECAGCVTCRTTAIAALKAATLVLELLLQTEVA
jgi:hypothetical protein